MSPIRLMSAYNAPKRNIIPGDLDLLLQDRIPTIVAGDFNAKHPAWNSNVTNRNGRILCKYVTDNFITALGPDSPTMYHTQGYRPDVIDIALLRGIQPTATLI